MGWCGLVWTVATSSCLAGQPFLSRQGLLFLISGPGDWPQALRLILQLHLCHCRQAGRSGAQSPDLRCRAHMETTGCVLHAAGTLQLLFYASFPHYPRRAHWCAKFSI